jgi:S-DNA-T family DNA segregation ATPase FtsK/SpoIIIE
LLTIAGQLTGRRLAVSCTDRSPLAAMTGAVHLPRDDQDHAVAMLDALCSGTAVMPDLVVDDIDLLPDGRLSTRLEELLRAGPADDRVIAVSAAADVAAAVFRGPLVQARRGRTGLLLCPTSRQDGELFGIRLSRPALSDDPAGRGWLVRNGVATRLQVAFPAASLGDPAAGLSDGGHLRGGDVRRANLNGGELGGGDFGSARLLG